MALDQATQVSIAFKKMVAKDHRYPLNAWYEETDGGGFDVNTANVFADTIPGTPPGSTTSIVKCYTDAADGALKLTQDVSIPNSRGWKADSPPGTRLRGWIPPKYGQDYTVKLYQDNGAGTAKGTQIYTTDAMDWFFDYQTGYLSIQDTHSYTTPFWIEAYHYVGETVADHIADTSNPHSVGYSDVTPCTTEGDLIVHGATDSRLGIGTNSYVLTVDTSITGKIKWAVAAGGVTDHGALSGLSDDDHTQYLLASGTRGLSANWDAGSYEIRAQTFESDVTTGTAPLTIASTTACTNLNADLLDGNHAAAFATSAFTTIDCPSGTDLVADSTSDTLQLLSTATTSGISITGDSSADSITFSLAINGLTADLSPATDDLIVTYDTSASAHKKVSLSSLPFSASGHTHDHGTLTGLSDDDHTQYLLASGTRGLSADWDAGSHEIRAQTFESDVATGTAPLTIASTTVCTNLNADLLDGEHASAFAIAGHTHDHGTITGLSDDDHTQYLLAAGTRPLTANWDAGSYEVRAQTFESDVTTGTAPLTIASTTVCTNLNADLLDGEHASAFADASHAHAAGDITSGTLAIARGGTNAGSFTASQIIRYNSGGTALESIAAGTDGHFLKMVSGAPAWAAIAGGGDVVGPGSSTVDALVRWDNVSGTLVADSTVTMDDSGNAVFPTNTTLTVDSIRCRSDATYLHLYSYGSSSFVDIYDDRVNVTTSLRANVDVAFVEGAGTPTTATNEIRLYNKSNKLYWRAESDGTEYDLSTTSSTSLATLTDVTITAAAAGDYLRYSGAAWVDATLNVVDDTTPQIGGDLDVNGHAIVSVSNGNIAITPDGSGKVILDTALQLSWSSHTYTMDVYDAAANSTLAIGNSDGTYACNVTLDGDLDVSGDTVIDGHVGIGNAASALSGTILRIAESSTATTVIDAGVTHTGSGASLYGLQFIATNDTSAAAGAATYGIYGVASVSSSTSSTSSTYGGSFLADHGGTVTGAGLQTLRGIYAQTTASGGGGDSSTQFHFTSIYAAAPPTLGGGTYDSAASTFLAIRSGGDVQLNSASKLRLGGSDTAYGTTYMSWSSPTLTLDLYGAAATTLAIGNSHASYAANVTIDGSISASQLGANLDLNGKTLSDSVGSILLGDNVNITSTYKLYFGAATGDYIYNDGSDLIIASAGDITLIPASNHVYCDWTGGSGSHYLWMLSDDYTGAYTQVSHASAYPIFTSYRTRGTNASKTTVADNDILLRIRAYGYTSSAYFRGTIDFEVDGSPSGTTLPTAIVFNTGTTAVTEAMRIAPDQDITMAGDLDVAEEIRGKTLYADGDSGGVASTVGIPYAATSSGSDTLTVKYDSRVLDDATQSWIKVYHGTDTYYVLAIRTI